MCAWFSSHVTVDKETNFFLRKSVFKFIYRLKHVDCRTWKFPRGEPPPEPTR